MIAAYGLIFSPVLVSLAFFVASHPDPETRMSNPGSTNVGDAQSDVLVVGAGVAGLTAARALTKRNISCLVLEAPTGWRTHVEPEGRPRLARSRRAMDRADADRLAALARELGSPRFRSTTRERSSSPGAAS